MSYVSTRNSGNPNFTNNSYKYMYEFIQPPAGPWSAQTPMTVTIDGDIMPKRDVDDAANGTDTWKILRGNDIYFALEAANERWIAGMQFQLISSTWPRYTYLATYNRPYIRSADWTQVCQNIEDFYTGRWIDLSANLEDVYSQWEDGRTIDGQPFSNTDPYRTRWEQFLDCAIGRVKNRASSQADFAPGSPLVANNVRKVYYDLQRLKRYSPAAATGQGWNAMTMNTTQWAMSSWSSYTPGFTPAPAPTNTPLCWYEQRTFYGDDGGWWGYYPTAGLWRFPRPGSLESQYSGTRTEFLGDVVACYLALHLETHGDNMSQQDYYEFRKVQTYTTSTAWITIPYNMVSNAAYQMVNAHNAGVPREKGDDEVFTTVNVDGIAVVCQLSDRTDISQIGWNWTP